MASLGYGLFLAINAASVWGGVFPFLPPAFQTPDVMLWFFGAESLTFAATFLASTRAPTATCCPPFGGRPWPW